MADCCDKLCNSESVNADQRRALWAVLWINVLMFVLLFAAAFWGKAISLFADCFDNLGDSVTYGISLWAVGKSAQHKARVALVKGLLILFAALAVVANIIHRVLHPEIPSFEAMGAFSLLALIANGSCLWILWKHKGEDLNMESVWHCSRNDIITNLSVLVGAGLVWYFNSGWPDVVLAGGLAVLLALSARKILTKSLAQCK